MTRALPLLSVALWTSGLALLIFGSLTGALAVMIWGNFAALMACVATGVVAIRAAAADQVIDVEHVASVVTAMRDADLHSVH